MRDPMEYAWWLASRASGIVALVLIALSVAIGLAMAAKAFRKPGLPKILIAIHEHAALAALVAIAVHGITLLGDHWLDPGILGITVPFVIDHEPVFTGLGIIGGYMAAILGLTFYIRRRVGTRRWRNLHRLTPVVYVLGVIHTLGSGSDAGTAWMTAAPARHRDADPLPRHPARAAAGRAGAFGRLTPHWAGWSSSAPRTWTSRPTFARGRRRAGARAPRAGRGAAGRRGDRRRPVLRRNPPTEPWRCAGFDSAATDSSSSRCGGHTFSATWALDRRHVGLSFRREALRPRWLSRYSQVRVLEPEPGGWAGLIARPVDEVRLRWWSQKPPGEADGCHSVTLVAGGHSVHIVLGASMPCGCFELRDENVAVVFDDALAQRVGVGPWMPADWAGA